MRGRQESGRLVPAACKQGRAASEGAGSSLPGVAEGGRMCDKHGEQASCIRPARMSSCAAAPPHNQTLIGGALLCCKTAGRARRRREAAGRRNTAKLRAAVAHRTAAEWLPRGLSKGPTAAANQARHLPKKGRTLRRGCSSRPHTSRLQGSTRSGQRGASFNPHASIEGSRGTQAMHSSVSPHQSSQRHWSLLQPCHSSSASPCHASPAHSPLQQRPAALI